MKEESGFSKQKIEQAPITVSASLFCPARNGQTQQKYDEHHNFLAQPGSVAGKWLFRFGSCSLHQELKKLANLTAACQP